MAVRIDRFGNNYADNVLSYKMLFENTSTWNVSSGTGSATEQKDTAFVGSYSLKIQNTDVVNDIVVTNATHMTEILKSGKYGFSFYLYKTESQVPISGNIKIFKNAVLLDTQTFTLGTNDADTDENEKWVRFMSDESYDFTFTDDITFTFTVDGIVGSPLGTLDLYIDGMMLYPMERNNYVTPIYSKPDKFPNLPYLPTDDGIYALNVSSGIYTWNEITDDFAPSV